MDEVKRTGCRKQSTRKTVGNKVDCWGEGLGAGVRAGDKYVLTGKKVRATHGLEFRSSTAQQMSVINNNTSYLKIAEMDFKCHHKMYRDVR